MPILGDLMEALLAQHIPEADRVAQALDLYVNGSLNFFNHRTTVDIRNRLVCFDIKGLGKNLKKPGMLIVQDAVWNTVTINRAIGRSTRRSRTSWKTVISSICSTRPPETARFWRSGWVFQRNSLPM